MATTSLKPTTGLKPTTSLNAYAAWLAKHETKAPKRRSLDAVETKPPSDSTDPYLQWIQRKETKLPAVKIVVATPEAIDAIVERGRAASALAQDKSARGRTKEKSSIVNSITSHANAKGKKRAAADAVEVYGDRVGTKKAKTVSFKERATKTKESALAVVEDKDAVSMTKESDRETENAKVSSRCSVSTSSSARPLPVIAEVQYWRDVDRFSFLA